MCTPRKSDRRASVDLSTLPDPLILRRAFFGGGKNPSLFPSSLPLHIEDSRANNEATCKGDRYVPPPPGPTLLPWTAGGIYDGFDSPDYTGFVQYSDPKILFLCIGSNYTYPYNFVSLAGNLSVDYTNQGIKHVMVRVICGGTTIFSSGNLFGDGNLTLDLSTLDLLTARSSISINVQSPDNGTPDLSSASVALSGFSFTFDP